ncbi:MAG: dodecin domain-containing protein [Burkholderiales bacterium]
MASSPKSFGDAVKQGISRADKTLKNVRAAWVKDHNVVVAKTRSPSIEWC